MTESPFFSVVIPTYNRAALIRKTLDSVFRQTFTDFEVIVVDDGSTDNTAEVVGMVTDARLSYYKKVNGERAAARNFGVQHAHGKYVTFLDSDDLLRDNHLQTAWENLEGKPDRNMLHLGYDIVDPAGSVLYPWKPLPDTANEKLAEGNFLSCMGIFVERSILLAIPFNEERELSGSEDYELWLRLAARYTIHTLPVATGMLVQHDLRSVTNMDPQAIYQRRTLLKKFLWADPAVLDAYRASLRKLLAYIDLYTALHLAMTGQTRWAFRELAGAFFRYPLLCTNYRFWVAGYKVLESLTPKRNH